MPISPRSAIVPPRVPATLASLGAVMLLAGCVRSPFTPDDGDYAKRVALSRLREAGPARLEQYRKPEPAPGDSAPTPAEHAASRFAGRTTADLSIEDCRRSVLANNLDLKVALIDPTIAAERVNEEEAKFNGVFTLRSRFSSFDRPTSSSLSSAQSNSESVIPGVRIPTRTGGSVTVELPVSRNETDNSFSTLNPSYTTDLEFSISQPLLRGAGRRAATSSLRIAGYDEQARATRTKLEVIRQLAAADRSYWRLYRARRELGVRQQQHELALEQLGRAERRVRAGAVSEIEVTRAQAGAADRLEAIILAQNEVLVTQRELKRIVNEPGLDIDSPHLVVTTSAPDPVEYAFDPAGLCTQAMANRMDLLELELQLAADAVRIGLARNQALPLLTLDYTYRVSGLGSTIPRSAHTLVRDNFADWELGLAAEVPLNNEEARSRVRQAILARLARLSTRAAREQAIREEVLNAIDQIDASWQRILASRQSVILNTRALQAEQRNFDVGRSTSTNVLDAATRLAEAQSAEIRALADYQIAQVDLAFATGTLLGASKVEWSPIERPAWDGGVPDEKLPE